MDSEASILKRDPIGVEKRVGVVVVFDGFNRLGTDVSHELAEVQSDSLANRSQITDRGMLEVAVNAEYRITCFVGPQRGRQRPSDRVDNSVLGFPKSQVKLKPDFSHPGYFLQ